MTSGGVTPETRWREVSYFPYEELHKRWQYHLLTMLKARVGTPEMKQRIDTLWQKYPNGLVAYLEDGKVPAGGQGLAYYLAKYVVSPPISLRRLLGDDGQRVRYWYRDHKSGKRQVADLPVQRFIGRMVQHILPKGFHRIRYDGSACYVQTSTCEVVTENDLGGGGSGHQGDVSGGEAPELRGAAVGEHGS